MFRANEVMPWVMAASSIATLVPAMIIALKHPFTKQAPLNQESLNPAPVQVQTKIS